MSSSRHTPAASPEGGHSHDDVRIEGDVVYHRSAGGIVLCEDSTSMQLSVALVRRADGHLYLPKGHLHLDEPPAAAAAREVYEELGLPSIPQPGPYLGQTSYTFELPTDGRVHAKTLDVFLFTLHAMVPLHAELGTSAVSAEWVSYSDAVAGLLHGRELLLEARQAFYYNRTLQSTAAPDSQPSLSLLIPTRNGARTLARTLESVASTISSLQGMYEMDVTVCLDHCTDHTRPLLIATLSRDEWRNIPVKVVENFGPAGKATALNLLVAGSSGALLCLVDDDVTLSSGCVAALIDAIEHRPEVRCAYAAWRRLPFTGGIYRRFWHHILGVKFDIQPYDRPSEIMRGGCVLMRRSSYVPLPGCIINDDEFFQTMYWPATREIAEGIIGLPPRM